MIGYMPLAMNNPALAVLLYFLIFCCSLLVKIQPILIFNVLNPLKDNFSNICYAKQKSEIRYVSFAANIFVYWGNFYFFPSPFAIVIAKKFKEVGQWSGQVVSSII